MVGNKNFYEWLGNGLWLPAYLSVSIETQTFCICQGINKNICILPIRILNEDDDNDNNDICRYMSV